MVNRFHLIFQCWILFQASVFLQHKFRLHLLPYDELMCERTMYNLFYDYKLSALWSSIESIHDFSKKWLIIAGSKESLFHILKTNMFNSSHFERGDHHLRYNMLKTFYSLLKHQIIMKYRLNFILIHCAFRRIGQIIHFEA